VLVTAVSSLSPADAKRVFLKIADEGIEAAPPRWKQTLSSNVLEAQDRGRQPTAAIALTRACI